VLETVMTFLTNTVSFSRVGAFALAHGGLSLAVYTLAGIVRDTAGGAVWSAVVIVLGNLLVLALEGLIVFVQCMRLEYYEFFSKFFEGGGKRYSPFRVG
jgi:V/A-type H+-transporting ATPase subunit I